MSTYYEILGISEDATIALVKRAYREKAKLFHPDLNPAPESADRFMEVEEAYSCLKDAKTRRTYDLLLKIQRERNDLKSVTRKYQQDVQRKTQKARQTAERRTRMNYEQYQRDDLFRTSNLAFFLSVGFTILTAVLLLVLGYYLAIKYVDPNPNQWKYKGLEKWGAPYILLVIGSSYIYEFIVRYIIVGRPKRKTTR